MPDETTVQSETSAPAGNSDGTSEGQPPQAPVTPAPDGGEAVKAKIAEAEEKAIRIQRAKDQEIAQLHQGYQAREKALREMAKDRLKAAGDDNADGWDAEIEVKHKAQQYDALTSAIEQQKYSEQQSWQQAQSISAAYGLDAADPRLMGAKDWPDYHAKCKAALEADNRAAREAEKAKEAQRQKDEANGRLASGALDTLGGSPAGAVGNDLSKYTINDSRELYKMGAAQARAQRERRAGRR